jgi:Ca2+:H+ antiporter
MKEIFKNPLNVLLVFVPVSVLLEVLHASHTWIFISSALAIIPLAGLMGKATEHLSEKLGPGIGGLMNASFGNAAELIIAFVAINKGMYDVVKASITGSIIGNILLIMGLSLLAVGFKHEKVTFNRTMAGTGSTLLALSVIALIVPAIFHKVSGAGTITEQELSLEISVVLFLVYLLSLVFALKTHKHVYAGDATPVELHDENEHDGLSKKQCLILLVVSTAFVALMAEFLVGAVEHTAKSFGMTEVFVGVILVAIIGNAAEHSTAIMVARKNQMDLAMNIAIGSSIQIALFVTPVLVFSSYLFAKPMDLIFTTFEVVALAISVGIVNMIASDGESNWLEGAQLLAVYAILALAFYHLP